MTGVRRARWETRPGRTTATDRLSGLFREVNDEIVHLTRASARATGSIAILCECGDPECISQLRIPAGTYRLARSVPGRSLFKTGHQPDGAQVVAAVDGYVMADT
jgi:hypothetical protein